MKESVAKNIKGSSDRLPAEAAMRNRITNILQRTFELYGYAPLETTMLNYLDLLTYKYDGGAEIVREIYKLRDQGDRDLGLRFDLTVPFCKVVAMNRNLKMPFKRYEIGKVFRNGPVKSGRAREFYQCDVDCVGVSGVHIEAELICIAVKGFQKLGIEPVVKYGNRKLLSSIIESAGIAKDKTDTAIGIVDKMAKVTQAELIAELTKITTEQSAKKLISLLEESMKSPKDGKNSPSLEGVDAVGGRGSFTKPDDIVALEAALCELGISQYCEFAPYLARGLNIYTGTVWEVFDKQQRITSSLGGGGRYDNIITNFIGDGRTYPAVGIGFGLEPIMAVLGGEQKQNLVDVLVIPMGTENQCQKFADKLRARGQRVLVYHGGGKVTKGFEYANAENIPYVTVIGEDEIKLGFVSMKNMATGNAEKIVL